MYELKEIVLKNKTSERKRLVIEFTQAEMAIIGAFLMSDAAMLDYQVLRLIDRVLAGKSEQEEMIGNRCSLTIKRDKTKVEDLLEAMFDDVDTYPAYEIETEQLRGLIMMWQEKNTGY